MTRQALCHRLLRIAFCAVVAKPVSVVWLGLHIRRRSLLPVQGPAIIVANHNSHLDTLVLLSLFPLLRVHQVRPAAAADYFMRNKLLAWVSTRLIGIVPVTRGQINSLADPLAGCIGALEQGEILLIFPEGTRGEPETFKSLRAGVARLAERFAAVPVVPVYMQGLGKAMPKGAMVPLPIFADIYVCQAIRWTGDKDSYLVALSACFHGLRQEHGRNAFTHDPLPPSAEK